MITLKSDVSQLRGVGPAKAKALAKAGILTVGDLCRHYPRAYQNRGDVKSLSAAVLLCKTAYGTPPPVSLMLTVATQPRSVSIRRGMNLTKFRAFDESGAVEITYFNQPFIKDSLQVGCEYRFWGRVSLNGGKATMANPVCEAVSPDRELLPIVPVYPLSAGLSQKFISGLVKEALRIACLEISDCIPSDILRENSLCTSSYALRQIHFPESTEALTAARRRLAFEEIFTLTSALTLSRREISRKVTSPVFENSDISPLTACLPFELTGAQRRSIDEIAADMRETRPMNRILCGDVGSGKTAVAAAAAFIAVNNGSRCAVMAPTEILAKQHFAELAPLFEKLGITSALLCGSMSASEKKTVRCSIAKGEVQVVIGTHALLSDGVEFNNFGLVITDEQHRFGANQRALLREKAKGCHSLAMSATPIPRTLSLVMYGDLQVSRLDEMPPGRKKVSTFKVDESYRDRLLGFIAKQKAEGHKTYVVCPAIEESEKVREESAEEACDIFFTPPAEKEPPIHAALPYTEELRKKLPGLNIAFVHGKMKTAEKDEVMSSFASGDTDVLVSTTVIEVGVNVPAATLMVVENAERFGLSQLHQLRGRVGRGNAKSYCILVSDTKNEASLRRLETMCRLSDGFMIAEEDLRQRGPGDFFSSGEVIRQSGEAHLAFSTTADPSVVEKGANAAKMLLTADPLLEKEENRPLKEAVEIMIEGFENTVS